MTTSNTFLDANFAPVHEEVTAHDLAVTGTIPPELEGRLLRIGPNPKAAPDPATYHWFTGDGMVHGIRLRDGRAEWYRNRWVGGGEVVNTHVIGLDSRTFALVEAGNTPVELTDELETVCHTDLDGTLPNGFTAHPKRDPQTGELFAMNYFWGLDHVQYVVVATDSMNSVATPRAIVSRAMVSGCAAVFIAIWIS